MACHSDLPPDLASERIWLPFPIGFDMFIHQPPTHGSWLNLVETLFGKMARTFLRGMRVDSWNELKTRILKGIAEINESPFVHRWSKFKILESGIICSSFIETIY